MPVIAQETIVDFLMWACGILGSGLIATLAWIALGVMGQLREIKLSNDEQYKSLKDSSEMQFKAFGQQLSGLHDLVMQDLHKHDVRIVRLEEWRKAIDRHAPSAD